MRHPKRKTTMYVNVYQITREYGGPEEGGWWYNWYQCVDSAKISRKKAEKVKARLEAEWLPCSYGNIYSVCGGEEYCVYIEQRPKESESRFRPYYC